MRPIARESSIAASANSDGAILNISVRTLSAPGAFLSFSRRVSDESMDVWNDGGSSKART